MSTALDPDLLAQLPPALRAALEAQVTHETSLILRRAECIYPIAEHRLNYSPREYRNSSRTMQIAQDVKRKEKAV